MTEDETLWPLESELQTISMIGTTLAERYKIERLLGEGGMGSVYLATDKLLGRQVAIKIMKASPTAVQTSARFFREARSLARLNHPNIVILYDYGWYGEQAYLVMEYATGTSLRIRLEVLGEAADSKKSLPIGEALNIAISVAKALSYAHRQGVIHRDIKPGNIMIGDEIKLMDFGIAKVRQDPSITVATAPMGTPIYMAPEQALGQEVDEKTDLYAFGVVLYEMLTGRPPFSPTDEVPLVAQHIQVTPVAPCLRNPNIPKGLDRLVLKMLAKDPSKRTASAEEVLLELETARHGLPTTNGVEMPRPKGGMPADDARIEALRGVPLFASMPSDDLEELSRQLARRRYRKGEIIFHKDDFGSTLHIVMEGNVKISIPSEEGDDVVLAHLGPGDFFGELALLDENPRSATASAIEATETLALERGDFLDFLKWYPDVAIRILAVLAQRLRNINAQLENIVFFNPPARLAKTLLKLVETYGSQTPEGWEISLPVTVSELARMAGVTTRAVRRLLRDLEKGGVVNARNRRYIVLNLEELRRRAVARAV